ncbi:DUF6160 family protein [Bacterioplanoides sp.]|uniref:DUF6160 family protein n=1 Tax=Bacterioplanoides sp. TaxID=2066072 RepID=UPI003B59D58B
MIRILTVGVVLLAAEVDALQPIPDQELDRVTGQAGLTVETDTSYSIGQFSYIDDSNSLQINDIARGKQSNINENSLVKQVMDIDADGRLHITTEIDPSRITVGSVRINNSDGSLGQFRLDYSGNSTVRLGGSSKPDNFLEGAFQTSIDDAELTWTTNGSSLSFDDIGYNANITRLGIGTTTDIDGKAGLRFDLDEFSYDFSTGGLKLGGVSLGTLSGKLALSGSAEVFGGGREGTEGIHLNANINILNDSTNFVRFTDDGNHLIMGDFNGAVNLKNLSLDVMSDHLLLAFEQIDGSFNADRILIGDSVNPVGAIRLDYLLKDGVHNGETYRNLFKFYPGIRQPVFAAQPAAIRPYAQSFYSGLNSNSEGLSTGLEWNLTNANLSYVDNGRTVIVSGIESFGRGDLTLDFRSFDHDQNAGTADKAAIAVGMNQFKGSYSIDGLKVGNSNAPIQGGAELLLSLEVFQAMDFNLDGYTYITAGGSSGGGIQIDVDYLFSDTNIGLSIDENGSGVWATGVNYDVHLRGFQIDVSNSGLAINRTEQWSTMDVNDMRWGDRNTGRSLGRIKLERFEKGSSLTVNPGGAGAVCVGATAVDAGSCSSAGGRWEDRGNEGITVALKAALAAEGQTSAGTTARNRLTWENNRDTDASGNAVNDTGTQIIFDGYSTNDGLGASDSNNFGLKADLKIDVYETRVLKKSSGPDAQGVNGDINDELIYNDSTRTGYAYVANPNAAQQALRPLGFAVQGSIAVKELQIDQIQLKHPDVAAPQTILSGAVLQNLNMTTNLTATPIR